MHESDFSVLRLVEGLNGVRRRLREDPAVFLVEILAGLRRQSHVPILAGTHDQKIATVLEHELGFRL